MFFIKTKVNIIYLCELNETKSGFCWTKTLSFFLNQIIYIRYQTFLDENMFLFKKTKNSVFFVGFLGYIFWAELFVPTHLITLEMLEQNLKQYRRGGIQSESEFIRFLTKQITILSCKCRNFETPTFSQGSWFPFQTCEPAIFLTALWYRTDKLRASLLPQDLNQVSIP